MNVRELIERLQRCDPDLPVRIMQANSQGLYEVPPGEIQSVGTDNVPRPQVIITDVDDPTLALPR